MRFAQEYGVRQSEGHPQREARLKPWLAAASWFLITVGMLIRLAQWLNNRSLWLDEAKLARNIIDRGPFELLAPLDYAQGAPVLFLLLVDAATALFGSGELAMRLIPLLSSLMALVLFLLVTKLFLETRYVPVAVLLFALSYRLIDYAVEAKQYSVDVTVTLALTYSFLQVLKANPPRCIHLICLGVLGSLATFLSHPSVFTMASIASILIVLTYSNRVDISHRNLSLVIVSWVVSFGVNYIFFLRSLVADQDLLAYWRHGFLPLPISKGAVLAWGRTASSFLSYSGFPMPWQVLVLVLVAVAVGSGIRDRSAPMLMIVMCFFYALCASVLAKYPFAGRLTLYALPLLILCVVRGVQSVCHKRTAAVCFVITIVLVVPYIKNSAPMLWRPIQKEEVRPLLTHLDMNRRPDDHVYIYHGAASAVKYYRRGESPESDVWHFGTPSRDDRTVYIAEIHAMRKWPRVWFLFAHGYGDEEQFFVSHIDGNLLERYTEYGASLYLYEFRQPSSNNAIDRDEE